MRQLSTIFLGALLILSACKKEENNDSEAPQFNTENSLDETTCFSDQSFFFTGLITDNHSVDEYWIRVKNENQAVVWDTLIDTDEDTVWVELELDGDKFGEGTFTLEGIAEDNTNNDGNSESKNVNIRNRNSLTQIVQITPNSILENVSGTYTLGRTLGHNPQFYRYNSNLDVTLIFRQEVSNIKVYIKTKNTNGLWGWDISGGKFNNNTSHTDVVWDENISGDRYKVRTGSSTVSTDGIIELYSERDIEQVLIFEKILSTRNFNGEIRVYWTANGVDYFYSIDNLSYSHRTAGSLDLNFTF